MRPLSTATLLRERSLNYALAALLASALLGQLAAGCSGCTDEAGGGGGDIVEGSNPLLVVEPTVLTFQAATPDNPETLSVTVRNAGTGTLNGLKYTIDPARSPFTFVDDGTTSLGEGAEVEVFITYTPRADQTTTPTAIFLTEAGLGQNAQVQLNAVDPIRDVQCEPEIAFESDTLGQPTAATYKIRNIGTLPVELTEMGLEFGDDLAITQQPELAYGLAPDETVDFELTYTPTGGGALNDSVLLTTASGEIFTCPVRASATAPVIDIAPARIDFGNVPVGETVTETVTVRNAGEAQLVLNNVEILNTSDPGFAVVNPPAEPVELAPGESTSVDLSYTAGDALASGNAVFASNDPVAPSIGVAVPLLGRPSAPDISVTPDQVNFGNVGQGVTATRTISIFNNGTEPLEIQALTLSSPSAEFTIGLDPSFPPTTGAAGTLAPGADAEVALLYSPTDLGADQNELIIPSNDPDTPEIRIPITANGLDRAECDIEVGPDPLNFGLVTRGSTRVLPVTIRNTGSGPCQYNGATVAGIFNNAYALGSATINNGDQIQPGQSAVVEVEYNPTAFDFNNGTMTLNISDPFNGNATMFCNVGERCANGTGNPFECGFNPPDCGVQLTGFSGVSDIAVIPGNLDFGLVTLGCASQVTTVTIYNTGTADLTVNNIQLEGCGNEFELRSVPPLPATIQADTPIPIQLIYAPGGLGEDQCVLRIDSDASESEPTLRVPLRGEGTNLSRQIDVFEQIDGRKVDVLFVIDGSGSMSEEQDNVASNLSSFLATAELLNNDFHLGVTHLDLGETVGYGGTEYEAGELMGLPSFLTRDDPNYLQEFQNRVEMGASGGSQEAGLEAARKALSDPYVTTEGTACNSDAGCSDPYPFCSPEGQCGGRNAGFIREDASLEIVILSDEEDQSSATPSFYTDFFQSIKGFRNDSLMQVSVIVGADISTNSPASCSSGNGDAEAGRRYDSVAQATGGSTGSICASSFASYLQNIGNRAFGLRREFFLSRVADAATIEVRLNGTPTTAGWTYDGNTNSIVFDRNATPEAGTLIEVEYEARCFAR